MAHCREHILDSEEGSSVRSISGTVLSACKMLLISANQKTACPSSSFSAGLVCVSRAGGEGLCGDIGKRIGRNQIWMERIVYARRLLASECRTCYAMG